MTNRKVAVVTGASQGMGLATTKALTRDGFDVVGAARHTTDELASTAAAVVEIDLAEPGGPARLIEQAQQRFGGVDVLVNNVGAFAARTDGFAAVTDEQWQQTFELNFFSAVRTIRAALPSLIERGGTIVNVSSIVARAPMPPVVDYASAKAALTTLGETLAQELGPQGVQVSTVSPGPTLSPAWTKDGGFGAALAEQAGQPLEEFLDGFADQAGIDTGRMTDPHEVAAVVSLLASGKVPNAHGSDWVLDGGQSKQI